MSQLTLFDYINGITIGSIAAEMATELEKSPIFPIIAMIIYGVATALISYICSKSQALRRIFNGKTALLYKDGCFFLDSFKKSRLDINEFMTQCRINGFFELSDIDSSIMEQNGKISFLPKSGRRPVTPDDMALITKPSTLPVTVILDGRAVGQNLLSLGIDEKALMKKAAEAGFRSLEKIALATLDRSGEFKAYKSEILANDNDIFM